MKSIGARLEYNIYYNAHEAKTATWERFVADRNSIIVAISALGLGIDISDIRTIFYLNLPRTMSDFI